MHYNLRDIKIKKVIVYKIGINIVKINYVYFETRSRYPICQSEKKRLGLLFKKDPKPFINIFSSSSNTQLG